MLRFESDSQSTEAGLWWLEDVPTEINESLADRVERYIRSRLQKDIHFTQQHIIEQVYESFPGLLTPSRELVEMCLQSYAQLNSDSPSEWWIISDEMPELIDVEQSKTLEILKDYAEKLSLKFTIESAEPLVLNWLDEKDNFIYRFYIQSHACISKIVLGNAPLAEKGILVLPDSRSNLLEYKKQQNPFLAERVAYGWHTLKYRHLRAITASSDLSLEKWTELLDADPSRWE